MAIDLPQIRQRITVDDSGFDQGMGRVKGKLGGVGKLLGGAVAAGAGAAGAAIGAFVVQGVRGAIEVERGVREVVTLFGETGDAADALTSELQAGLRGVSDELGIAQTELTGGLYQAISAGVPKDNAFEFLKVAGQAAVAGVTDVETAVDGLTTTLNAFGLDASRAQDVADSMFAAVQGGKTTFEELSASLFQVAPAAASAGIGFEEVNAGIATLTSQGTPTAVATTQMRQAIVELAKPGTKVGEIFEDVAGKSFRQFIEEGGNLEDALGLLQGEAETTGAKIGDYFGSVEAANAATGLAETGAAKYREELARQAEASGSAQSAFETMNATTTRQWEIFTNKLTNAAIAVGSVLLPALNEAIGFLSDKFLPVVDEVAGFLTVVFGGSVEDAGDTVDDVLGTDGRIAQSTNEGASQMQGRLGKLSATVSDMFTQIRDTVTTMMEAVKSRIGSIMESVSGIFDGALELIGVLWDLFGDDLLTFVEGTFSAILRIIDGALAVIHGVIETVLGVLTGDWSRAWEGIKTILGGVWDVIMGIVERAIATVRLIIGAGFDLIRTIVGNVFSGIVDGSSSAIGRFVDIIAGGVRSAVEWFKGLPGRILDAVGNVASLLLSAGRDVIQGLIDGIMAKIDDVKRAVSRVTDAIGRFLPGSPVEEGPLVKLNRGRAGAEIAEMVAGGIVDATPTVTGAMDAMLGRAAAVDAAPAAGMVGGSTGAAAGFSPVQVGPFYGPVGKGAADEIRDMVEDVFADVVQGARARTRPTGG